MIGIFIGLTCILLWALKAPVWLYILVLIFELLGFILEG